MFKRFMSLLCAVVLILSTGSSAYAATNSNELWTIQKDGDNKTYLQNSKTGEKIVEAVRFDEAGNIISVDLVEYASMLNNHQQLNQSASISKDNQFTDTPSQSLLNVSNLPVTVREYIQNSAFVTTGGVEKCTADVVGPANISYGNSIGTSESFNYGANLTGEIKKVIKAGATFSWVTSSSSNTSFNLTFQVPAGKTGYVMFQPYLNYTYGNVREVVVAGGMIISDTKILANATCPKVLSNGFTDGIFALALK
ncbi:hypothetical protein [Clostridium sp. KNHs205]|jgi:hypothetical protein|uniref:hypothetical protein n=1 Tax=Clostridium sp. KNHs205 TaxID=1449050 RepID=UPI00051AFFF7|nr:hypothetical protein [Clostridium sp. KNHs205]